MSAKKRTEIPKPIADPLVVANRHTCCICRERKDVHIHHIDGDPSNNDPENLLVVCTGCHSDVHSNQGLGRSFTPGELRIYKKEWEDRCRVEDTKKIVIQKIYFYFQGHPDHFDTKRFGEIISNVASGATVTEVYQHVKASAEIVKESTGDPSSGDQFKAIVLEGNEENGILLK